jgi:hypothetical protein
MKNLNIELPGLITQAEQ